ncbi:MAG: stage III sporulation protein AD [Ruminococcus sp.]|uniref:SpoIIIAC/SpoIIIAD family protein n=1 Tax=Ruminococcus sp. TaxID=41978 RepID=UPI0025F9442A|nr:SpoIIIAC/SpoIIIAD family protein [Ruminococcus sp.]MBO4867681.1 stage III sporulation protein AD [Ruminococcus sp.]
MNIVIICAFAVVSAVMCKTVNNDRSIAIVLTLAASAVIFMKAVASMSGIIAQMRSLFFAQGGSDPEYMRILLKGLGICYITSFASGICRDSGESTLAEHTVLAGKTALLLVALPMLETLIGIVKTLLM